jgi:hypothetical protein
VWLKQWKRCNLSFIAECVFIIKLAGKWISIGGEYKKMRVCLCGVTEKGGHGMLLFMANLPMLNEESYRRKFYSVKLK